MVGLIRIGHVERVRHALNGKAPPIVMHSQLQTAAALRASEGGKFFAAATTADEFCDVAGPSEFAASALFKGQFRSHSAVNIPEGGEEESAPVAACFGWRVLRQGQTGSERDGKTER
jgi:hypothetical protein